MPRSEVPLRRNGRQQACEPCRLAKNRCDHATPVCNRCMLRGKPDACVYHPAPLTVRKTRDLSMSSPAKLSRLLPETQSPQTSEILTPVSSLTPPAYTISRNTLFRRPVPRYASTSFSAVFSENQAQIGAELLNIEEDGLGGQPNQYDDPVRMKLAISTLKDFPTTKICERLSACIQTMYDSWLSPMMINHCLKLVWSNFGEDLDGTNPSRGLSHMAAVLFKNGEKAICPDENQAWVNWFGGSALRWEMIGVLFTFFGMAMMRLQDFDPVFNLPELRHHSKRAAARQMKECADVCLNMRNTAYPTNDIVVCLIRNNGKLYSQIAGDESDEVANMEALATTAFIDCGLHCLPESATIEPHSEFRKMFSTSVYYAEKSGALFKARPPALSRFYCSYQIPVDLTEEELFGTPEELNVALSQLDKDGWNTCGRITTNTWLRARSFIIPIREEILEISLGRNMQVAPGRIDQLLENLTTITSSYPSWLQYRNIHQWSQPSFSPESSKCFYIVSRIHAEVLQTRFLLERLRQPSLIHGGNQDLFDVAQEMMAVTLSLWLDRDRLYTYQSSFHWMAVDSGIPAAGVLCVELLYATRHPFATNATKMSRTDTIQSLMMYVAFLEWVRPGDGNYELCRKLKKVIRNILDYVLAAPSVPAQARTSELRSSEYDSTVVEQIDPSWTDLGGPDWLNMLTTMDWTQGFGMEIGQQDWH